MSGINHRVRLKGLGAPASFPPPGRVPFAGGEGGGGASRRLPAAALAPRVCHFKLERDGRETSSVLVWAVQRRGKSVFRRRSFVYRSATPFFSRLSSPLYAATSITSRDSRFAPLATWSLTLPLKTVNRFAFFFSFFFPNK